MGLSISEDRLQQLVFIYHWNAYPEERGLLFMVYNNAVNKIQGAQLKSKGMVKGVSDMVYLRPGGKPILLELKTTMGKQSPSQSKWQSIAEKAGYVYAIATTMDLAKEVCGWTR